jgi:hypothetical protein
MCKNFKLMKNEFHTIFITKSWDDFNIDTLTLYIYIYIINCVVIFGVCWLLAILPLVVHCFIYEVQTPNNLHTIKILIS